MCAAVLLFPATIHHALGLAGGLHFFIGGVVASLMAPLVLRTARRRGLLADQQNALLARATARVGRGTLIITVLLLLVVLVGCNEQFAHERALAASPGPNAAAVAIRDHVPLIQKYFTARFTQPHLRAYDRSWYITATRNNRAEDEFLRAVSEATLQFENVDIFVLVNTSHYYTVLRDLPPAQRQRIRMVYNTGAGGARETRGWVSLQLRAYVGHAAGNVAPLFYVHFLPLYLQGEPLDLTVEEANLRTRAELSTLTATVLMTVAGWFLPFRTTPEKLMEGTRATLYPAGAPAL